MEGVFKPVLRCPRCGGAVCGFARSLRALVRVGRAGSPAAALPAALRDLLVTVERVPADCACPWRGLSQALRKRLLKHRLVEFPALWEFPVWPAGSGKESGAAVQVFLTV